MFFSHDDDNFPQGRLGRLAHRVHCRAKDHFVPHEGNGYVPKALHHKALFAYTAVLIGLKVLLIFGQAVLPAASLYSSAITPANVVSLTNEARKALGLPALAQNAKLSQAASAKAQDMLANQYFAHTSPAGTTPWSWIVRAGYTYRYAGENLAVHFFEAEDVQSAWMASPSHRANIVDPRYEEIGVGIARGRYDDYDSIFVVQMFGRPAESPAAPAEKKPPQVAVATLTEPAAPAAGAVASAVTPAPAKPAPTRPAAAAQPVPVNAAPAAAEALMPQPAAMPVISEASVSVLPQQDGGYAVSLRAEHAEAVAVHLGEAWVSLSRQDDGSWSGVVPALVGTLGDGEQLHAVATGKGGVQATAPLAFVAPLAEARDIYAFSRPQKTVRFFGLLTFEGLEDRVRQVYLLTMVLLAAGLLVTLLVKLHVQRHAVTLHAMVVMFLAFLFTVL